VYSQENVMLLSLFLVGLLLGVTPEEVKADVVLVGGLVVDGSGKPGVVANVAVADGKIVAVGKVKVAGKPRLIDVKGLVIAPGFIDLHSHSDYPLQKKATRANQSFLFQGATTVVTGNCGAGPADVAKYFAALEKGGIGTNVLHLIPHNTVRQQVMKNSNRAPTSAELEKMKALVEKGMKDGACGIATGLIYTPGTYSKTEELVALAKVVGKHGGMYASHIRDEGVGVVKSIEEALTIGKEGGLRVHISHLKASGKAAWGKSLDIVATITKARKAGQEITADQYPYEASSTSLTATVVPTRFREGEKADYLARLKGEAAQKAIAAALKRRDGGASVRIARFAKKPEWQGKSIAAIARAEKMSPLEVVLEIERNGGAGIVNFGMSMDDVRVIMKQPWVATASDGVSMIPDKASVPHPRSYGTFARKVGRFGIADKLLSLEQAVRSSSGLPADILRLKDRGYVKVGQWADVVVFDPKKFRDRATYDKPHQFSEGVRFLFVNGVLVIDEGKYTGKLPGRVIRKGGKR
jgi:N-acyl-D-aspartate/D-glutamate deacylase